MSMSEYQVLVALTELERQLITPETKGYAYPSYAGSVRGIVNGKNIQINSKGGYKMQYCIDGKPRHFKTFIAMVAA